MQLKTFVEKFVCNNSLIRLWYPCDGGHQIFGKDIDTLSMEWELIRGEGVFKDYVDSEVIGVTDILVDGHYKEAINIVIER